MSLAELLALLQIGDRAAECFLARADHLGGDAGASDVQHALQQVPTRIDFAEHVVGADVYVVERDPRGIVRIDRRRALDANSRRFRIDDEQRDAVGIARLARGASDDDQEIRDVAIKHESLRAVELEAVAGASGGHRGFFGMML